MIQNTKSTLQASLLVSLSGILYGFLGFLGTKLLEENLDIPSMLFWRFLISGVWMLLFVCRKGMTQKLLNLDKHNLIFILSLGAIGYASSSGFYFLASEFTGTGLSMVIFFSYPILIAVYSWIFQKSSFNLRTFLMLLAMMFGLILLGRDPAENVFNFTGIFFGTLSALTYAFYIIGSKKYSSGNSDSNLITMLVSFACAAVYLICAFVNHSFSFPTTAKSWITLLALGIFATAIPIQLMLEGLKKISSMRASIISVLEPIVTVIVGIVLLEEVISYPQMIGALVILGSALLVQFQKEL